MAEKLTFTGPTEEPFGVDGTSAIEDALRLVRTIAENSAIGLAADEQAALDAASEMALQEAISRADLSQRLRVAVEIAATKSQGSMEALRLAVCAFTKALRNEGVTPEAVLIRLKAAIQSETLLPLWRTSSWSGPQLHESIVTWCIMDYFHDGECGGLHG